MRKIRADKLLVDRHLAPSRQRASALIMAGSVLARDVPVRKAGQLVDPECSLRIRGHDHPFVSRGGVKLAHAIDAFGVGVAGKICMDVGVSTGGFTDCLLQNGARKVYAIDVGYGQLAPRIASDERVVVMEKTNIRYVDPSLISDPIEIAVVDVSFISLAIVLPAIDRFILKGSSAIALIKPQFEVGKGMVGRGGIVRDPALHRLALKKIEGIGKDLEWECRGVIESPIEGARGNREFFIHFLK